MSHFDVGKMSEPYDLFVFAIIAEQTREEYVTRLKKGKISKLHYDILNEKISNMAKENGEKGSKLRRGDSKNLTLTTS